jgi:MATE family multidrug resistance protein
MNPGPGVQEATRTYVTIRMFAAPFSLINYAILGLLARPGQGDGGLALQTLLNGINIAGSTSCSAWCSAGRSRAWPSPRSSARRWRRRRLLVVCAASTAPRANPRMSSSAPSSCASIGQPRHHDPLLRAAAGFSLFTRTGAQFGAVMLAANAILMNFFMIAGYYLDGFATAAEQIVGRAIGAQPPPAFWRAVRLTWPLGLRCWPASPPCSCCSPAAR